jgi:hypothetical protein
VFFFTILGMSTVPFILFSNIPAGTITQQMQQYLLRMGPVGGLVGEEGWGILGLPPRCSCECS